MGTMIYPRRYQATNDPKERVGTPIYKHTGIVYTGM